MEMGANLLGMNRRHHRFHRQLQGRNNIRRYCG